MKRLEEEQRAAQIAIGECQERCKALSAQLETATARTAALEKELGDAQKAKAKALEDNACTTNALQREINSLRQTSQAFSNQLRQTQALLVSVQEERKVLQEELNKMQQRLSTVMESRGVTATTGMAAFYQEQIAVLQRKEGTLREENAELTKCLRSTQAQFETLLNDVAHSVEQEELRTKSLQQKHAEEIRQVEEECHNEMLRMSGSLGDSRTITSARLRSSDASSMGSRSSR